LLRKAGLSEELHFHEFAPSVSIPAKTRCSVATCKKEYQIGAGDLFKPVRNGYVMLCGDHRVLYDELMARRLDEELLFQWSSAVPRRRRSKKLSDTDEERLRRIGKDLIAKSTNRELYRERRELGEQPGVLYQPFRHSINRIRNHEELPSSESFQKKK
jgi:hypothetical protein